MITFTRAREVRPGEFITSRQHNLFARAVNERILSGLGDACFRIAEYLLGLFRAVVVGDLDGKTHAEGEYFEVFQSLRPNVANYPAAGVDPGSGLPEENGPNIANPFMAWAWGNKAAGIDPESTRLNRLPAALASDSIETKWAVAKQQRGAVDPHTGYVVSPARDLAWEIARFAYTKSGPFGTTWGGYLPGPSSKDGFDPCMPPCDLGSESCNSFARENLDIIFTAARPDVSSAGLHFESEDTVPWALDPGQSCVRGHYAGTCSPCIDYDPELGGANRCPEGNYSSHIAYYWETPAGYSVRLNDGTVDFLPHNDWVEGPYSQVRKLSKDLGEQLSLAVNAFCREFRGSDSQRGGAEYNLEQAFDNQAFFTRQYALAPARGLQVGNTLQVKYPSWRLGPGTWSAGQALESNNGGASYSWQRGFVATHWFGVIRSETTASVRLVVTHAAGSFQATVQNAGTADAVGMPSALQGVTVALDEDLIIAEGEELLIEFTELEPYRPSWRDLYAVLRKGGALLVGGGGGEFANAFVDGHGTEEEKARTIWADYLKTGCIVNQHDVANISDPTAQNENAVAEAVRRLSKSVRIFNRFALIDYEVTGGKSVLYFSPHPRTADHPMTDPRDDGDPDVDLFEDMDVRPAADGQFGSRWVVDVWLKAFHNDPGNIWRPETYGDQYVDINRCVFNDAQVGYDQQFMGFVNRQQRGHGFGAWFAQAPSGWNYAQLLADNTKWINHATGPGDDYRIAHAKSCRIYEPPVEVESIERFQEAGRDVVRVTLKGRLHNTSGETGGAADSVPRSGWVSDPLGDGAWDHAELLGEPWRSTENALRLYLCYRWKGDLPPLQSSEIPGDKALTSYPTLPADGLMASILPHIYFVQLIPEAPIDRNDVPDSGDAPFDHDAQMQAAWYLRCMAEGCVAGAGALDCSDRAAARMYDWHWATLCTHAFGLPSLSAFATAPTTAAAGVWGLRTEDVRPDGPEGFGPLPNTYASSEVFNRLVLAVNSLTRYRVMLPWKAEHRAGYGQEIDYVAGGVGETPIDYGCGPTDCCGISAVMSTNAAPPTAPGVTWDDWADMDTPYASAYTQASLGGCGPEGDCPSWAFTTDRKVEELRFSIVDWTIYQHAVPPLWRDMVVPASEHVGAMFSRLQEKQWVDAISGSEGCLPGSTCSFVARSWEDRRCVYLKNGTARLDCGPTPPGGWAYLHVDSVGGTICGSAGRNAIELTLIGDTCPVLEIPLQDRQEWEATPWLT